MKQSSLPSMVGVVGALLLIFVLGCDEERPPAEPWCGDGVIQEGEQCDTFELAGETCGSQVP